MPKVLSPLDTQGGLTLLDAKGDLIAASGADTPAKLTVGSNGQILIADSSTATGLRWGADAGAISPYRVPISFTTPDSGGFATWTAPLSSIRQGYPTLLNAGDGTWNGRSMEPIPANYGTSPALKLLLMSETASNNVRLTVSALTAGDGEDLDPALTALTVQDVAMSGTARLSKLATFTAGMPTLTTGEILIFSVLRSGAHANDTHTGSLLIAAAWLEFTPA